MWSDFICALFMRTQLHHNSPNPTLIFQPFFSISLLVAYGLCENDMSYNEVQKGLRNILTQLENVPISELSERLGMSPKEIVRLVRKASRKELGDLIKDNAEIEVAPRNRRTTVKAECHEKSVKKQDVGPSENVDEAETALDEKDVDNVDSSGKQEHLSKSEVHHSCYDKPKLELNDEEKLENKDGEDDYYVNEKKAFKTGRGVYHKEPIEHNDANEYEGSDASQGKMKEQNTAQLIPNKSMLRGDIKNTATAKVIETKAKVKIAPKIEIPEHKSHIITEPVVEMPTESNVQMQKYQKSALKQKMVKKVVHRQNAKNGKMSMDAQSARQMRSMLYGQFQEQNLKNKRKRQIRFRPYRNRLDKRNFLNNNGLYFRRIPQENVRNYYPEQRYQMVNADQNGYMKRNDEFLKYQSQSSDDVAFDGVGVDQRITKISPYIYSPDQQITSPASPILTLSPGYVNSNEQLASNSNQVYWMISKNKKRNPKSKDSKYPPIKITKYLKDLSGRKMTAVTEFFINLPEELLDAMRKSRGT